MSSNSPTPPDDPDETLNEDLLPEDDAPVFEVRAPTPPANEGTTSTTSDDEENPKPVETLNLTDIPSTQRIFEVTGPFDPIEHNAKTRRILGFTSLGVLGGFYAAIFTCFVANLITLEELSAVIAAFSGLQTLAAAVFGYYFAKDN